MDIKFNYNNVYLYFLSLFGAILILSLLKLINDAFVINYSMLGIAACITAWILDEYVIYRAEEITESGMYVPNTDDPEIHERLGYRNYILWGLSIFLGISLFIGALLT